MTVIQCIPMVLLLVLGASRDWKAELESEPATELVAFVELAAAKVAGEGAKGACEAFRKPDGEWFGADSYVFVLETNGTAICHPSRPDLEGRNLSELRDPDGRQIMAMITEQLARGSGDGWVHYLWPRPGQSMLEWKSTYVVEATAVDGGTYVIGSGAYNLDPERAFVKDRVAQAAELVASRGEAAFSVLRDPSAGFVFLDSYVFVIDMEGNGLVNARFPELEGRNVLDVVDEQGKSPARAMIALLQEQDEGWVAYYWPRPGDERPTAKTSFVKRIDMNGTDVLVGAGIYSSRKLSGVR